MIWVKTVGVALLLSGFGSIGLMGARRITQRVEHLRNIRLAVEFLEKEISYLQTPLSYALQKTAQMASPPVDILFRISSQKLQQRQGTTALEAWNDGLVCLKHNSALSQGDIQVLKSLGPHLGMSGSHEQKQSIKLIQEELGILQDRARAEAESGSKLWSYGGFVLGATLVLLLI